MPRDPRMLLADVVEAITIDLLMLVRTVGALLQELDAGSAGQAQNPSRDPDA